METKSAAQVASSADAVSAAIAEEIRVEMARQRRTAAELSTIIGVSQHTAGRRLNGVVPFDMVEVAAAAQWLGVDVAEIVGRAIAVTERSARVAS